MAFSIQLKNVSYLVTLSKLIESLDFTICNLLEILKINIFD